MDQLALAMGCLVSASTALSYGYHRGARSGQAQGRDALRAATDRVAEVESQLKRYFSETTFYRVIHHPVLLDGAPATGKSALVAKWVNPSADVSQMRKSQGVSHVVHFLCSEPYVDAAQPGKRLEKRHQLSFLDVPGERAKDLREWVDERPPEVLVFVVDPDNIERSVDRFSQDRIAHLYGARTLRANLKCSLL